MRADKMLVDKMSIDKISVHKMPLSVDRMCVNWFHVDNMSLD